MMRALRKNLAGILATEACCFIDVCVREFFGFLFCFFSRRWMGSWIGILTVMNVCARV